MAGSAESQNNLVEESLDGNRVNLMQQTYQMLGMQANYLDVSNSMVEMSTEALYPFHRNAAGDFWTSASVRDHTVFGSTYPEFLGLSATDSMVGRVNALYGGSATSRFSWEAARGEQHIASSQSSDVLYQYSAVIRGQHIGPGGVSKVFVFLDATLKTNTGTSSTHAWMSEPGFVGYAGFQNAVGQAKTEMQTNGVVALTAALEDRMRMGELRSMDEIVVGTYLQEKLHWLLVNANDNVTAPEDAPDFSIGVSWARVTPGTASTLPAVLGSGFQQLPHATMGKAGGVQ
ncbi:hypothetical protein J4E93_008821 [Alternaria ventricosa]|uniref:uncharacterized protein n=1 Tax=Alternaria ventricosa TaxID=1187951 RepID=UPI0020C3C4FA|nr:uncharacterized protein J4E93_008821 [Alternaria ventricosa]KAI4640021.1 hypothetical protein J4E93_008821 [Alternaria ventricosa]